MDVGADEQMHLLVLTKLVSQKCFLAVLVISLFLDEYRKNEERFCTLGGALNGNINLTKIANVTQK